ncbi:hypothetical protein D9619_010469 [Psilocybe cf. subviscida]|uniref:Aminoglycoside phosphotransferase domain-containing protein n=1 Tax=Psilocybe cf. subviscida TaxID=2480587 RepID=A0A8H5ASA1_9AGAR|nr:hypothetical protein D9619_010469 [Psilocybe cf. subviscida]
MLDSRNDRHSARNSVYHQHQRNPPDNRHAPWVPTSRREACNSPDEIVLSNSRNMGGILMLNPVPGVIVKCFPNYTASLVEELLAMRFARNQLSLPVPKLLHHPSLPSHLHRRRNPEKHSRVWYICMEQCPGVALSTVVDEMTPSQLDHVATQLKSILHQMATYQPKWLGSVYGAPYLNFFFPNYVTPKNTFSSVGEFHDHIRWMLELFCTPEFTDSFLRRFPRNAAMRFTHGDLLPKNIVVSGSTITGIIDWETAGFYPEYWEYARMHDHMFSSPGWDGVLHRVFPSPRRE